MDLNQRINLPGHRAWTIGRWLLLPLILLLGFFALPKTLADGTQIALQQQASAAAAAANSQSRAVIAKQTLAAQTVLTADNVELRVVPPDAMQPNVETDINDVVGKALVVPVVNGQQILTPFLLSGATSVDAKALTPLSTVAIVSVDAANLRSSPSIAASVLGQVKYGTELWIIGQTAGWYKVQLPDRTEGWVAAGWIVKADQ